MPEGIKHYSVNGQVYDIPESQSAEFLDYHKKQGTEPIETILLTKKGDKYDIPFNEVGNFLKVNPDAKPFYNEDAPFIADVIGQQARGQFDQLMDYGKQGARISTEEQAKKEAQVNPQLGGSSYAPVVPDLVNRPESEIIGTLSGLGKSFKSGIKDAGAALLQVGDKLASNAIPTPSGIAVSIFDNAVSKVIEDETTPLETRQALNDYLTQPKTILGRAAQTLHASAQKDMPDEESLATMVGSIIPQMGLVVGTMFVPAMAPATLGVMGAMGGGSQSLSYVDWIRNRNKTADPVTYNPAVDMGGLILGAGFEMAFEHFGSFARYGINKAIPKEAANTLMSKLFTTKSGEKLAENVFVDFIQKQPALGAKLLKVGKQILEEGGEEGGTELANLLTESLSYRDDMTINEVIKRTAMSVAAGGLMGAMISPVGTWAQNKSYDAIREQNGFIALASTKAGEAFEVFGQQGNNVFGVNAQGERVDINENDIEDYVKMSPEQFSQFKTVALKSAEAVGEEAEKQSALAKLQPITNQDDGLIHAVTISGEEGTWYKVATNTYDPNIIKVRNDDTGEERMLSLDSKAYTVTLADPVSPQQVVSETIAQSQPQQQPPIPRATFDGKTWTPGQAVYNGKPVIIAGQNEDGTLSVTLPDGSEPNTISPKDKLLQESPAFSVPDKDATETPEPSAPVVNGQVEGEGMVTDSNQQPTQTEQIIGKTKYLVTENPDGTDTFDLSQSKNPEKDLQAIKDEVESEGYTVMPIRENKTIPAVNKYKQPTVQSVIVGATVKKATPMNEVKLPSDVRKEKYYPENGAQPTPAENQQDSNIDNAQVVDNQVQGNIEGAPEMPGISTPVTTPVQDLSTPVDETPAIELKPKTRKSFWQPGEEAKQLASRDPETPEEAVMQYFVMGGKIAKQDYLKLTGFNEQDNPIEVKKADWAWDENGTPVDELVNSIDTPMLTAYVESYGSNAIQNIVQDLILTNKNRPELQAKLKKLQQSGYSEEEIKRMSADADYRSKMEEQQADAIEQEIFEIIISEYDQYPPELFNFTEYDNRPEQTETSQEAVAGASEIPDGTNRNEQVGSVEGDGKEGEEVKPSSINKILSASSRKKPNETIGFNTPIVGLNGNKLVSYTWAYEWIDEWSEAAGDTVAKRISDWTKAEQNAETGRDIVHQFTVQLTDGTYKVVSSESVLSLLGFADKQFSGFGSLVNALKTLSKYKLQLSVLNDRLSVSQKSEDEINAMDKPEITRNEYGEDRIEWVMGDARVVDDAQLFDYNTRSFSPNMEIGEERLSTLVESWKKNRFKEIGLNPYSDSVNTIKGKIAELNKKIERHQDKVNNLSEQPTPVEQPKPPIQLPQQEEVVATGQPATETPGEVPVSVSGETLDELYTELDRLNSLPESKENDKLLDELRVKISEAKQAQKPTPAQNIKEKFNGEVEPKKPESELAKLKERITSKGGEIVSERKTTAGTVLTYTLKGSVGTKEVTVFDQDSGISAGSYGQDIEPKSEDNVVKETTSERVKRISAENNLEDLRKNGTIRVNDPVKIAENIRTFTGVDVTVNEDSGTVSLPGFVKTEQTKEINTQEGQPVTWKLSDVDRQRAIWAYSGTSFSPEKRADTTQQDYVNTMDNYYEELSKIAKSPEQIAVMWEQLAKLKAGYLKYNDAHMRAQAQGMSTMIAGPANFPVRRMEKVNRTIDNRRNEWIEWENKAEKYAIKAVKDAAPQAQKDDEKWQSIKKTIEGSAASIIAIERKQSVGSKPLFVNSIGGFIKRMGENGQVEDVKRSLELVKTIQDKYNVQIFSPTNPIWQLSETVQPKEDLSTKENETIGKYKGVTIENNIAQERVQLMFDEKPTPEIIEALKSRGFRWSPFHKAWQRKNTREGISVAEHLMGKYFEKDDSLLKHRFAGDALNQILKQSEIGFYSTVDKALNSIQQSKGTPEQFKAMLLKNGAKQAEMDWMDFDGNFSDKKSVTKQEVQDWIDGSRIEVKEVQKGLTRLNAKDIDGRELSDDAIYGDSEGEGFSTEDEAYEFGNKIIDELKAGQVTTTQQSLPITPSLRESVLGGVPLFHIIGQQGATAIEGLTDNLNVAKQMSLGKGGNGQVLFTDEHGKQIVYDNGNYRIAVDDSEDARYITLWHKEYAKQTDKEYWVKRGVLDAWISKFNDFKDRDGKYLSIRSIEIEKDHRGKGYGNRLYQALIDFSNKDVKGVVSYLPNRVNKKQVPSIYKRLGGQIVGDYHFIDFKPKDAKTIFLATGWEKFKDGWRYEIQDSERIITDEEINKLPRDKNATEYTEPIPLSDVIKNDVLFNSYPELKNWRVAFFDYGTFNSMRGITDFDKRVFVITKREPSILQGSSRQNNTDGASAKANTNDIVLSAITHEVEHSIQQIEGFNTGANRDGIYFTAIEKTDKIIQRDKRYYNLSRRERFPYVIEKLFTDYNVKTEEQLKDKLYWNNAGEVEARNAQTRLNLSPEERKAKMLSETQDVAEDQKIYLQGVIEKAYSISKPTHEEVKVRAEAVKASMNNSTPMVVVNKPYELRVLYKDSLSKNLKQQVENIIHDGQTDGFYDPVYKQLVVISSRINSIEGVDTVVHHELTHATNRTFLGNRRIEILEAFVDEYGLEKATDELGEGYEDFYPADKGDEVIAYAVGKMIDTNQTPTEEPLTYRQIVDHVEGNEIIDNFVNRLISTIYHGTKNEVLYNRPGIGISPGNLADTGTKQGTEKTSPGEPGNDSMGNVLSSQVHARPRFAGQLLGEGSLGLLKSVKSLPKTIDINTTPAQNIANKFNGVPPQLPKGPKRQTGTHGDYKGRIKYIATDKDMKRNFLHNPVQFAKDFPKYIHELVRNPLLSVRLMEADLKTDDLSRPSDALVKVNAQANGFIHEFETKVFPQVIDAYADIYKAAKLDQDAIGEYLYAKASLERTDNQGKPAFSEDPNDEWNRWRVQTIVKDFEDKVPATMVNNLWKAIKLATDYKLDTWERTGKITPEDAAGYKARKFYVPLKGWENNPDDFYDYKSKPFSGGNTIHKAVKRTSRPEGNPIEQIVFDIQDAIKWGQKNLAYEHLYNLAVNNPDKANILNLQQTWLVKNNGLWTEVYEKPDASLFEQTKEATLEINGLKLARLMTVRAAKGNITPEIQAKIDDLDSRILIAQDGISVRTNWNNSHYDHRTDAQAKEHEVRVWVKGKQYIVTVNDPNVASAIKGENLIKSLDAYGKFGKEVANLTRAWQQNVTGKSLNFFIPNTVRDVQAAAQRHAIMPRGNAVKFVQYFPTAEGMVHRYVRGTANPVYNEKGDPKSPNYNPKSMTKEETQNYWDWFMDTMVKAGARSGYVHMKDLSQTRKDIRKVIKAATKGRNPLEAVKYFAWHKPGRLLEWGGIMSEDPTRIATAIVTHLGGHSNELASTDAKEITVNFDRGSRIKGVMSPLSAFFQARVEGTANHLSQWKRNPKGALKAMGVWMAAGALLTEALRALMDDEEKKQFENLQPYVKYGYYVIPKSIFGLGSGLIRIPLPHGFSAYFAAGRIIDDVIRGYITPKEGATNALASTFNAFTPVNLDGNDLSRAFVPPLLTPVYDAEITNKDFAQRTVSKPYATEKEKDYTPKANMGLRDVSKPALWISRTLNNMAGGDWQHGIAPQFTVDEQGRATKKGTFGRAVSWFFDVNPSKLEHDFVYYTGGRGELYTQAFKLANAIATGEEVRPQYIPVVSRFTLSKGSGDVQADYYNVKKKLEVEVKQRAIAAKNKNTELQAIQNKDTDMRNTVLMYKNTEAVLKVYNEIINGENTTPEVAEKYKAERTKEMAKFMDYYNKKIK